MAHLTSQEFDDLITLLSEHYGFHRLHERLLRANALVSRKRPAKVAKLAYQLYQLSAGLRREHPARYAVEALWQDMFSDRIGEDHSDSLEKLATQVNDCLGEHLEVVPEKRQELLTALAAYHKAVGALTNANVAYIAMLLRATNDVAAYLREHQTAVMDGSTMAQQNAAGTPPAVEAEGSGPAPSSAE